MQVLLLLPVNGNSNPDLPDFQGLSNHYAILPHQVLHFTLIFWVLKFNIKAQTRKSSRSIISPTFKEISSPQCFAWRPLAMLAYDIQKRA